MGFGEIEPQAFRLTGAGWRTPQLGALGSLLGHWTVTPSEPALVSLPTGTGKTGVALAAPFIAPRRPERVLVLVPSRALREQIATQFRDLSLLVRIGALDGDADGLPMKVSEIAGISTDWATLDADVVVAIPQSISPASEADISVPPAAMFDMVIVDEAHHAPSKTWLAILDHLSYENALLLTATPFRRDRKAVPGTRVFHYPLRHAIDDGSYKPVTPMILSIDGPVTVETKDQTIKNAVVELLRLDDHQSSALLVRAGTIDRANKLASMYQSAGLQVESLTQRTSDADFDRITSGLVDGSIRGVAVVGMLGEGYDLPRLRVVAYHDKHKSTPATVQLIGRLARVSEDHPQDSVLVTVNDADAYPELQGAVRDLYQEDPDWATILPGLVDAEVIADRENRQFIDSFDVIEGDVDPSALRPMPTPTVLEVWDATWRPSTPSGELPAALHVGATVGGARVLTSLASPNGSMILLVTRRTSTPKWCGDGSVQSVEYGLSVVSFRAAPRTDLPSLLFVDAADGRVANGVLEAIKAPEDVRVLAPERIDGYLQSLPRLSVSSIGMRNLLAGTRGTSYKTRAGRGTDVDLPSSESAQTSLGHVMMQISTPSGASTSVGAAFEKGKVWQRRYKPLIDYEAWTTEAAQLLWFPLAGPSRLIPQVSRGQTLDKWPSSLPLAAESNQALAIGGYWLHGDDGVVIGPIEDFELHVGVDPTGTYDLPPQTTHDLPIVGVMVDRSDGSMSPCWLGVLTTDGQAHTEGQRVAVSHGYGDKVPMDDFITRFPPLVYFVSGEVVQGRELFQTRHGSHAHVDADSIVPVDWVAAGVDTSAETRKTAAEHERGISVHAHVEYLLRSQPRQERYRWIICNDGAGEIADHLLIEHTPGGPVRLGLWHSKAAGGEAGLRVNDFQVVVAQALRSRSYFNDPELWVSLRERLQGRQSPTAELVDGSDGIARLLVLLGEQRAGQSRRTRSWPAMMPLTEGEIVVVQPGLSKTDLFNPPEDRRATAESLRQLLAVFADTVVFTGRRARVLASE